MDRRTFIAGLGSGSLGVFSSSSRAQSWPTQPIKLMVAYAAGGSTDLTMRIMAEHAARLLGQPIIVEARPGAGGTLVSQLLQQARPDGYTLGQIPLPVFRLPYTQKLPWDPLKDLSYVIGVSGYEFGIMTPADTPLKSWPEFVAWARANPGKLSYATSGLYTTPHLTMEDLAQRLGLQLNHVPYKGNAEIIQAVLGGQVMCGADSISFAPHVAAGRMRALVTWGEKRQPKFPDTPTLKELGIPIVQTSPYGIGGPRGMDAAIVDKLHEAFRKAILMPDHVEALARYDQQVQHMTPAQFRAYAEAVTQRERAVVERLPKG